MNLPKITIITPSLNQSRFIEETIRSVLNQNYPNLEFLIIDGGSTDGTMDIVKKYSGQLNWISEKDSGQSNAINKGLRIASGEVVAYLNSDDLYVPGALLEVGNYFSNHSDAIWFSGRCYNIDPAGNEIRKFLRDYKNFWLSFKNYPILLILNYISQPATFWRRSIIDQIGFLDENLHYTMDYDYWLRLGKRYALHTTHNYLACFRLHPTSKSSSTTHLQFEEEYKVAQKYCSGSRIFLHYLHYQFAVLVYKIISQGKLSKKLKG